MGPRGRDPHPAARHLPWRLPFRVLAASALVVVAITVAGTAPAAVAMLPGGRPMEPGPVPSPAPGVAGLGPRSTYPPCAVIAWAYDAAAQPAAASSMLVDVRAALALVGGRTGIAFTEVPIGAAADLVLDWAPLADYEPGTQAAAWRSGVKFAIDAEMARDEWSGFGRKAVRRGGGSFDVGIGRGWLVVHEVLHSLGLGHSDEAGSVMSPVARITNVLGRAAARGEQRALPRPGFSPGDLANLAAMYPREECPASRGVSAG